jgi:tetratricopeptide (TPR) repeat protein
MNIYLSWSGELGQRASRALSRALHQLIPNLEVFSSGSVTIVGTRWIDETTRAIKNSDFALVCITSESRSSPWLLWEVGVMTGLHASIVPWLVDVGVSDLYGPLAQFQAIRSDAKSFRKLADLISRREPVERLSPSRIERWSVETEEEITQLVGGGHEERRVRSGTEWLKEIADAVSGGNLDQLQTLKSAAEVAAVTDQLVLRALVNAFFALRDYTGLIDTFDRFKDRIGQDPEALSRYALALVRTGQSSRAIVVLEQARRDGLDEPDTIGLLARAYKDQWREQAGRGDPKAAEDNLRRAAEIYTEGFRNHPSFYSNGLNAVKLLHILGDERSLSLRDELLPEVQSAVERAAPETGDDFWLIADLLDLAVVRGAEADAQELVARLRSKGAEAWQIAAMVENLLLLSNAKGFGGEAPEWLHNLVTSLAAAEGSVWTRYQHSLRS